MILKKTRNFLKFYTLLNNYLNSGYKIISNHFFNLILRKEDEVNLILDLDKPQNCEVVLPNFNETLINYITDFKNNYLNKPYCTNVFDKKYEYTLILILDGMGENIFLEFNKRYPKNFLKDYFYTNLYSIYPSTTAAATTSIKSGLTPFESGWTGWYNYLEELDKNIILFKGIDYYTNEFINKTFFDFNPYKYYFEGLNVSGASVEPDFSNKHYKFKYTLKRALKNINSGVKTMYLYDTEPDSLLHRLGTKDDIIYKKLYKYSKLIKKFYKKLPKNTLMLISADHGHKDSLSINLYEDIYLLTMLKRRPTNDERCLCFSVKEEYKENFENYFNIMYGSIYKLYKTQEAIDNGFFGKGIKNKYIDTFLADYVALAYSNYNLKVRPSDFIMKSSHAGITKEEMIVPLIVLKK